MNPQGSRFSKTDLKNLKMIDKQKYESQGCLIFTIFFEFGK
jgi:hypothetical protein